MAENADNIQDNIPVKVNKGPFYGIVIMVIGLLFLISSFFIGSSGAKYTGTVTYASALKQNEGKTYQQLKVKFEYNGKIYETACNAENGNYLKHDEISFKVINNDPTNISVGTSSSGKGGVRFFGILLLVIGILLFLNIISYEIIESFMEKLPMNLKVPKQNKESNKSLSTAPSALTGILNKVPKMNKNAEKDEQKAVQSQIKKKKTQKKKQKEEPTTGNLLDLYNDDED